MVELKGHAVYFMQRFRPLFAREGLFNVRCKNDKTMEKYTSIHTQRMYRRVTRYLENIVSQKNEKRNFG